MTLICILIGLGIEYYFHVPEHFRNYTWFDRLVARLESGLGSRPFWNGTAGVLIALALPLVALYLLGLLALAVSPALFFLLGVAVFVYSLGPFANAFLNRYIDYLRQPDTEIPAHLQRRFDELAGEDEADNIVRILNDTHRSLFGVVFWFIALGMPGAMLFALAVRLEHADPENDFADAARRLCRILRWPTARLMALGLALAGSLVHSLEAWREVRGDTLSISDRLLERCGLGALQYRPGEIDNREKIDLYGELRELLERCLIVWLSILGIMTLAGWLS